ncbi:MAG: GNAT family N-acetyltransferase [Candidatus Spyradocola sp.]
MELAIQQLTGLEETLALYDTYKACMYRPDREKYRQMAQSWLQNDAVRIFACYSQQNPVGILVLHLHPQNAAEILGIAVSPRARNHGVATHMLQHAAETLALQTLTAETDAEAVDFYRKTGFQIQTQTKTYDGIPVTRYLCTLTLRSA